MDYLFEVDDPIPPSQNPANRKVKCVEPDGNLGRTIHERMVNAGLSEEEHAAFSGVNIEDPELVNELAPSSSLVKREHQGPIFCMELHDDPVTPFIVTSGRDGVIRLFHLNEDRNTEPFCILEGHEKPVFCLATYSPAGERDAAVVISGSKDASVRVWIVATKKEFKMLKYHMDSVMSVKVAQPQGLEPVIVSGGVEGWIIISSMLRGEMLRKIVAIPVCVKTRAIFSIQIYYEPDGTPLILSGGEDQVINLWSIDSGELQKVFVGHSDSIHSLAICHNYIGEIDADTDIDLQRDAIVVSGSKDCTVRIWSVKTTEMLRVLREHTSAVLSVFILPLSFYLHESKKSDLAHKTMFQLFQHKVHKCFGRSGDTASDETTHDDENDDNDDVAATDDDNDDDDDKTAGKKNYPLAQRESLKQPVSTMNEQSPDSTPQVVKFVDKVTIFTSGKDRLVCMWNLITGKTVRSIRQHSSAVTVVRAYQCHSDSKLTILSASTDRFVSALSFSTETCTKLTRQAYDNDILRLAVPANILMKANIPEEFQNWPHLWLLIHWREKMTIDEFFADEQFFLFSNAIADGRSDFVELFLPLSPTGMLQQSKGQSDAFDANKSAKDRLTGVSTDSNFFDLERIGKLAEERRRDLEKVFSFNKDLFGETFQEGVSILRKAIIAGDIRITLCILDTWKTLLNSPPRDWMDQCRGAFTRLPKSDLVALAKKFPIIFQNFICDLKIQSSHPFILRGCNSVIPVGKEYLKTGTNGCLIHDIELWKSSKSSLRETMIAQYLPIAYAADLEMLKAYTDTCNSLDTVDIFQSEVGAAAVKFAWSKFGLDQHLQRLYKYGFFILIFVGFVMTDVSSDIDVSRKELKREGRDLNDIHKVPAYCLIMFVFYQVYEHIMQCMFERQNIFLHFTNFWPLLELLGAIFILYSATTSIGNNHNPSWIFIARFLMSINLLIQMVTALSFFRAFENTGPLVSMIIRISYDIRFYLFLLSVILFGFSLSFWCLCTGRFDHPSLITYHNISTSSSPAWYQAPLGGNDDPQGTYAFATIQGAYLQSFIFLTGQFSIVPFTACGYEDEWPQSVNRDTRGFAIFLSGIFAVLVQIMMVNVLIALMTESYARLSERGVAQARLMQAQLMCESASSLSKQLRLKKAQGKNLQAKIIHILKRAADHVYRSHDDDNETEGLDKISENVAIRTDMHGKKMEDLLRSTQTAVDSAITEQEETLFRMRRSLELLTTKTRRLMA